MRHRGDELCLHLFALADLQGHRLILSINVAHFIVVFIGDLDAVAAVGNSLGSLQVTSATGERSFA